jgi:hypothetical protein
MISLAIKHLPPQIFLIKILAAISKLTKRLNALKIITKKIKFRI